jgi:hypothetical protein
MALIIFVVSEKKAFEHFPIGSNVNLCIVVVAILDFFSETTNMIKAKLYMNVYWMVLYKLYIFCSDRKLPMIIPGQFGFNCPSGFREEAF